MKSASIALDVIGCKLNQAESESLSRDLIKAGYRTVSPDKKADVYILNTCTVTHVADRKARHLLRMAHRRNPDALIIATGCYAVRAAGELEDIEGVGLVTIEKRNQRIIDMIANAGYIPDGTEEPGRRLRTRAMLKIQQGCSKRCSYCIVPHARGKEVSIPAAKVLDDVKALIKDGYKEVVLTGTHIGSRDDIEDLVQRILYETDIDRLRLSSLEPADITLSLIKLWRNKRLCRHIHLPLQSGSDAVLKRMGREYSTSDYTKAVDLIRQSVPDCSVTTDMIVGFPQESDSEFEESYHFCKSMCFANLHVFTYSPRPGTPAAALPDLSPQTKKARSTKMLQLAKELSNHFRGRYIGQTMLVLWEEKTGRYYEGFTDNYIRAFTESRCNLANTILPVELTANYRNGLMGRLAGID